MNRIELDPFVLRQFEPKTAGTNLYGIDQNVFISEVNSRYIDHQLKIVSNNSRLLDGPWDFCKYLVIDNCFDLTCNITEITLDMYPFIRTGYSSRTPEELPILSRWVELPSCFKKPKAKYIVCILYSREKLLEEFNSKKQNKDDVFYLDESVEYGIVAIQATQEPYADPIPPITSMRNALGMDEGGNGEKLDREMYNKSVEFWEKYILIK